MNETIFKKALIVFFPLIVGLLLTGLSCGSKNSGQADGGVFKSLNRGESWEQIGFVERLKKKTITINGVNARKIIFDPSNPEILYLGTNGDGLFKTTNGGGQWKKTGLSSGKIASIDIDPKNTQIVYATVERYLMKSEDGGANWKAVYTDEKTDGVLYNVAVDSFDPQRIYLSNDRGGLFKSYTGGESWQKLSWFEEPIQLIRINPRDTRKVFLAVADNNGLYFSENGGTDWLSYGESLKNFGKTRKRVHELVYDNLNPSNIYLGTDYGLLRSSDEGNSWAAVKTLLDFNTPITVLALNPLNPNQIYYSDRAIIYRSDDAGFNWSTFKTLPSKRTISQLIVHPAQPEILYAGVISVKKEK